MGDLKYLHITGVYDIPGYQAAAAITTKSSEVFKEEKEISPRRLMRMYSKLWRAHQAYLTALTEETQEEQIPF